MALASKLHYDATAEYAVTSRDIEYRRDGAAGWLARVYEPQGGGPFPLLISVHGGAWRNGDRLGNAEIDEPLARSGIAVVAVDFRTSAVAPYPTSMADVNYAVRWLKAHAAELNATAAAMGGAGFSSGGHMVMLGAMRPRDPRYTSLALPETPDVDASLTYVIMGWPVIDPLSRYHFGAEIGRPELVEAGELYFGDEAGMQEANPQLILERGERVELPPALLVQGAADASLTPGMAERFVQTYGEAGGVIELGKYPGAPHGFLRDPGQVDANARRLFESNRASALALMKSFIERQVVSPAAVLA